MHTTANGRKKKRLSPFNLIEVTLAIGIVAVGMAGLMVLFPIGFNATRDAIGENYSADMADQLLHVMAYYSKTSSAYWTSLLGDGTTAGEISEESSRPTSAPQNAPSSRTNAFLSDVPIYKTSTNGIYYMESITNGKVDFAAHAIVWKTPTPNLAGATPTELPWDLSATINVEISWPVQKPYDKRAKRYYQLTVFNPNP